MNIDELKKSLEDTYDDKVLSENEMFALSKLLEDFSDDENKLRFVRNYAFKLAQRNADSANSQALIKWLGKIVKTVDNARPSSDSSYSDAYFSPGDQCRSAIIAQLNRAKKSIDICVFTITDDRISNAIREAHERRVTVRIITDNDKAEDRGSDIYKLAQQDLNIRTDIAPDHMHNKFAIIDGVTLINGSFNWTRSASTRNQENITITDDQGLTKKFIQEFNNLWPEMREFSI